MMTNFSSLSVRAFFLASVPLLLGSSCLAQERTLEERALQFAQAWVNSDGDALVRMMGEGGILLHLQGEEHHSILPRPAKASLMSFFHRYEGGEAEVSNVSLVGGDPSSGFAEIRWGCRISGTKEPVIFTLFVAFDRSEEGWMVTEIRLLS